MLVNNSIQDIKHIYTKKSPVLGIFEQFFVSFMLEIHSFAIPFLIHLKDGLISLMNDSPLFNLKSCA